MVSIEQYNNYSSEYEKKLVAIIIKIMDTYTQEMENYSYYGSNKGMSVDDYEDCAQEILKEISQ